MDTLKEFLKAYWEELTWLEKALGIVLGLSLMILLVESNQPPVRVFPIGTGCHQTSLHHEGHNGFDWGCDIGSPVYAICDGDVVDAKHSGDNDGYGVYIVLSCLDRDETGYWYIMHGHLSEAFVEQGDVVNDGAVLGSVGSTGNSTGPHLHWEIRSGRTSSYPNHYTENPLVNPLDLLVEVD